MFIKAIAQFNECFPPIMDGVSVTVQNYALWLNRTVSPTYVVTPAFPGYTDHEEFPVIRYTSAPLPFRPPYRLGLTFLDHSVLTKLKQVPLSIVHSHSPFSAGHLAQKIAGSRDIPLVTTFHSKYRDDFERLIPNKSFVNHLIHNIVKYYESADEVWIPQKSVEPTLREYGYRGNIEVVENGIDFPALHTANLRKINREKLSLAPDGHILLFVGQHIWEKNLRFLLSSLELLPDLHFTMYFIGQGYAREQMEEIASRSVLRDKVKFLGPVYNREVLMQWYAAADLFVFPSLYDNAPLVLREAAAMQTPGLLLEGSTTSEVIVDGQNGFLTPQDTAIYAEKIRWLLENKAMLHDAGERASKTICRPWQNIMEEVSLRYQGIIRRKKQFMMIHQGTKKTMSL